MTPAMFIVSADVLPISRNTACTHQRTYSERRGLVIHADGRTGTVTAGATDCADWQTSLRAVIARATAPLQVPLGLQNAGLADQTGVRSYACKPQHTEAVRTRFRMKAAKALARSTEG